MKLLFRTLNGQTDEMKAAAVDGIRLNAAAVPAVLRGTDGERVE